MGELLAPCIRESCSVLVVVLGDQQDSHLLKFGPICTGCVRFGAVSKPTRAVQNTASLLPSLPPSPLPPPHSLPPSLPAPLPLSLPPSLTLSSFPLFIFWLPHVLVMRRCTRPNMFVSAVSAASVTHFGVCCTFLPSLSFLAAASAGDEALYQAASGRPCLCLCQQLASHFPCLSFSLLLLHPCR